MSVEAQKATKEEIVRDDDVVTIDAMLLLIQLKEAPEGTLSELRVLPLIPARRDRLKDNGYIEVKDKGYDRYTITPKGREYVGKFALKLLAEKVCNKTSAEVAELLRKTE